MPSGNEPGANSLWVPGGYTSGGIPEAIIDQVPVGKYTVKSIINGGRFVLKKIFEDYGVELFSDGAKRYIRYDDGGIVSHFTTVEISPEDAELAQISSNDAYNVIIKYQNIEMGLN